MSEGLGQEHVAYVIGGYVLLLRIMDYSKPLIVSFSIIGRSRHVIVTTTACCAVYLILRSLLSYINVNKQRQARH